MPGGSTEDGHHTTLASQLVVVDVEIVRSIGYVELHDGVIYSTELSSSNRIPSPRAYHRRRKTANELFVRSPFPSLHQVITS
jgi:hypothetical protein